MSAMSPRVASHRATTALGGASRRTNLRLATRRVTASATDDFDPQVCVVLGTQWGDEGKGKLVDVLAQEYGIVARAQGGANAGTFCLHVWRSSGPCMR